jgi:hypothetical protein
MRTFKASRERHAKETRSLAKAIATVGYTGCQPLEFLIAEVVKDIRREYNTCLRAESARDTRETVKGDDHET